VTSRILSNQTLTDPAPPCMFARYAQKLTPKLIDNLFPPAGKRYEVRDELVVGLLVRVSRVRRQGLVHGLSDQGQSPSN
jgi:hypothetical protein